MLRGNFILENANLAAWHNAELWTSFANSGSVAPHLTQRISPPPLTTAWQPDHDGWRLRGKIIKRKASTCVDRLHSLINLPWNITNHAYRPSNLLGSLLLQIYVDLTQDDVKTPSLSEEISRHKLVCDPQAPSDEQSSHTDPANQSWHSTCSLPAHILLDVRLCVQ